MRYAISLVLALNLTVLTACYHTPSADEQIRSFHETTGLSEYKSENLQGYYLSKVHRGYQVLYHPEMGEVWGRFTTRMIVGEVGREVGGIASFLTGSYNHVGGITGSPFDRALSSVIGQPISLFVILKHNKANAPRLDVLSNYSTIQPNDPLPKRRYLGFSSGNLYSHNVQFAENVYDNKALLEKINLFRSQYIRVDENAVTFLFAGSENEYSGMIRNADGLPNLTNAIMDSLAEIANAIPKS